MTITNILLAGALLVLCVIAYELRALIKRMESLSPGTRVEGDPRSAPRFAPSEATGAGQTINVNLSPLQASVPGMQSFVVPFAGAAQGGPGMSGAQGVSQGAAFAQGSVTAQGPADDEPDEAKRARERERALAAERERAIANAHDKKGALVSATQSGLIAVKCPTCGTENSAYRNVCFNCGKAL